MNLLSARARSLATAITHRPIILPVNPWRRAKTHCSIAAATARGILLNFAEKSLRALIGNFTKTAGDIRRAIRQIDIASTAGAKPQDRHGENARSPHHVSFFSQ